MQADSIAHVLAGMCDDPDCELHHIEVAIEEEVVGPTEVCFWLAGWSAALEYITNGLDEVRDEAIQEGFKRVEHSIKV
jgi:hypothetical protein